jgi:hypothetical protein
MKKIENHTTFAERILENVVQFPQIATREEICRNYPKLLTA